MSSIGIAFVNRSYRLTEAPPTAKQVSCGKTKSNEVMHLAALVPILNIAAF